MKYWYVVIPVHVLVSVATFIMAYCISFAGCDVFRIIGSVPFMEKYVNGMQSTEMGHVAVAAILLKLMTPLRFMVTVASSSMIVQHCKSVGWSI